MFSYILSFFNYLFNQDSKNYDDECKENFLAEQLLELEIASTSEENEEIVENNSLCDIPRNTVCFERTGIITFMDNNSVLIDGMLYYDTSNCLINLNVNDKVLYLGYRDRKKAIVVVRILENLGISWGNTENIEENDFKVIEHVMIGEVENRSKRVVFIKDSDLKFNLDNVEGTFIPVKGDWLEMNCSVQWDENKSLNISTTQVLEVKSFKPLRRKIKTAIVTAWTGDYGTCDRQIFFNKQLLKNGVEPLVGSKILVEAIESNQETCSWRAINLLSVDNNFVENNCSDQSSKDETLELEKEKNIQMTHPLKFSNVNIKETSKITLAITNNSDKVQYINKWIILGKKRESQINIKPFLTQPKKIFPKETINFTITCQPKFFGNSKEYLIIMFKGFQFKRFIEINIVDDISLENHKIDNNKHHRMQHNNIENMLKIRKHVNKNLLPGVKPLKPPAFIPVRLGNFPIPEKFWSAVLGDSEQVVYSFDYDKIIARIEQKLPCLGEDLNINNYINKWHTLLYMEEIQANINMRSYDMQKAFLTRFEDYLGIEINGLSEKRPSLMTGDRVIVKDVWNLVAPQYEGYIHKIKGDIVLMKFNPQFHESYNGSDVSVEFHFSRSVFRRFHQAINLALSNLGPNILFPRCITPQVPRILPEQLENIIWYNKNINSKQKTAICNILLAENRPMPYCIYGPPGTGKTVTVIEAILQILTLLPDSRILVATPSNSASNLITERLVQYRSVCSGSIVRLIANYILDSGNIPDIIKPFCATLDITTEKTAKSKVNINKDGIHINCRTSFIGRHRVTIGTCSCIGTLAQMGLPQGHFTHIIIDEAGQATEPEIMIPMTFIDKESGQIILAGDPMQLGPVIVSRYCKEYGMEESYLARILETFPYQRDYEAFEDGFNEKLVTKLNNNYRSLEEVLTLPSEMFYDASLVAKINRKEPSILNTLNIISEVFELQNKKPGGIFVYGIRGYNFRAEDSPSWYNPQEAAMIALTTCKLYKKGVAVDEIGIITPYIAQIKHLRTLFEAMGLPEPKIGTVEEFQGQEKPIVIISTVRSTETYVKDDLRHALGFVKQPKRLNVALTRAQLAIFLFCNPHILCRDPLWNKVITYAVKEDKYMGCDLPYTFNSLDNI